jgi:hypothetical protein
VSETGGDQSSSFMKQTIAPSASWSVSPALRPELLMTLERLRTPKGSRR